MRIQCVGHQKVGLVSIRVEVQWNLFRKHFLVLIVAVMKFPLRVAVLLFLLLLLLLLLLLVVWRDEFAL